MPEPGDAFVELLCDPARLKELKAIANLRVQMWPEYTADPAVIRIFALADAAAQDAARALGCTVTVHKTTKTALPNPTVSEGFYNTQGDYVPLGPTTYSYLRRIRT